MKSLMLIAVVAICISMSVAYPRPQVKYGARDPKIFDWLNGGSNSGYASAGSHPTATAAPSYNLQPDPTKVKSIIVVEFPKHSFFGGAGGGGGSYGSSSSGGGLVNIGNKFLGGVASVIGGKVGLLAGGASGVVIGGVKGAIKGATVGAGIASSPFNKGSQSSSNYQPPAEYHSGGNKYMLVSSH